ncbi:MAG: MBL fold metallo-hydrolase [Actinomycetota bacterium]|nr:MBL fold metallo-hydrolase [Actinomycetota bacterium]
MPAEWNEDERRLTGAVSVLMGAGDGAYPSGNSLLVVGDGETIVIDPSITVVERGGVPAAGVDAVINSHSHEDHVAGNGLYPEARVHVHHEDLPGVRSLDGLMDVYGFDGPADDEFRGTIADEFHYTPRPDAEGFGDGHVFDLGAVTVEAVHLPGHTRGHSGFRISGGVFFLSDIDLTGFGPYYGDVWSDLDDFEDSLAKVRHEDARFYVTFHHKGVIESRELFVNLLDDFAAVIGRRHAAMLDYLAEPRTLDDMAAHRFIYRPHVELPIVNAVERRSAQLHVQRMLTRVEAVEVEPGRFQRAVGVRSSS